jgi:hypothetical protein
MAELFGPGSGVTLLGEKEDQVPEEVRALLDSFGLSDKSFQCILKEIPAGSAIGESGSGGNTTYIKGWTRTVPSLEYIARSYGPGSYLLCFSWPYKNEETGKRENQHEEVQINISEKVSGEFKKERLNAKIREAGEIGSQVRDALIEKKVEGEMLKALTGKSQNADDRNPADIAKEYITSTLETVKLLGLQTGVPQTPARTIEWDKILPVAATIVTAFLTSQQAAEQSRRDEFNKMLMLLMSNSQNSNTQLLDMMKMQSGAGSGNMAIREFKDMVLGALDIKEALSGNTKESLGDKIFRLVESVAPSILSIAATTAQSAQAAASNPVVKMAKGYIESNPDFQALKLNPVEMKKTIDQMDRVYGWVQVDHILKTIGWDRPENCPRMPEYKDPAPDGTQADFSEADTVMGEDA